MTAVGAVVLSAVALWAAVAAAPWRRRRRQRRRERRALELRHRQEAREGWLAQQWTDALAYCHSLPSEPYRRVGLAHVTLIYGAFRRGTKAEIRWYGGDGAPQDTWFELAWPQLGDWLVVAGGKRYGRHNDNPETFYAHILGAVPAGAWLFDSGAPLPNTGSPIVSCAGATDQAPAVVVRLVTLVTEALASLIDVLVGFLFTGASGASDQPPTEPAPAAPADAPLPQDDIDMAAWALTSAAPRSPVMPTASIATESIRITTLLFRFRLTDETQFSASPMASNVRIPRKRLSHRPLTTHRDQGCPR